MKCSAGLNLKSPYPDGQCGALYGQIPPLANASKPPGQRQVGDIPEPRRDFAKTDPKKPTSPLFTMA
jgi:hypothetical protein